jgi:hypothetical protein
MLSGIGYKPTFIERLFGHPHLENITIHLLTLVDVLAKTDQYYTAVEDIPKLKESDKIDWKQFR